MLPRIDPHQRRELPHHRILVSILPDPQRAGLIILHQPRPPASLDSGQRRHELRLHLLKTPVVRFDALCEGTGGGLSAALVFGREVLEEEGVV